MGVPGTPVTHRCPRSKFSNADLVSMAKVVLPDSFTTITQGPRELTTQATCYRDLVAELKARWPRLSEELEKTAVAIDGQIYQDAWLEAIEPDSEVFFMARIEGG